MRGRLRSSSPALLFSDTAVRCCPEVDDSLDDVERTMQLALARAAALTVARSFTVLPSACTLATVSCELSASKLSVNIERSEHCKEHSLVGAGSAALSAATAGVEGSDTGKENVRPSATGSSSTGAVSLVVARDTT